MKTTKFIASMALAVVAMTMASCLNGGHADDIKVTQTYPGYMNEIIDNETGDIYLYAGVGYTAEINYSDNTATLKLEQFRLPDGTTFPTLSFNDVPWTFNERGWQQIYLRDFTPEGVGSFMNVPVFDTFLFQSANRYISSLYVPMVNIKYTVGRYTIFSLPSEILEVGETVVTNVETGEVFKPNDIFDPAIYLIQFDPVKKTGKITMSGVVFHKDMPQMNIRFSDVPFETTTAGDIVMSKDELIPGMLTGNTVSTATETPMPAIPITNLKVTYDPDRGLWVSYTCTVMMEKFKGKFDVTMINKFPDKIEN